MDVTVSAGRLLLYHKHGTSARTRFYCTAEQHVCLFAPLPSLSYLLEERERPEQKSRIIEHPAQLLSQALTQLALESGAIELDNHCLGWIDTPDAPIPVHLGHFTAIDPPLAAAELIGARFIAITEARHLSAIELELLRRAYCFVLGG